MGKIAKGMGIKQAHPNAVKLMLKRKKLKLVDCQGFERSGLLYSRIYARQNGHIIQRR